MTDALKKSKGPSFLAGSTKFLKEVKSEIKKVIWPTRKQVINNTIVVIISIFVVGIVIWVLDIGFGGLVNFLIRR
jgi:preprotein translocase subunit SecE